jgi:hypothetical protein
MVVSVVVGEIKAWQMRFSCNFALIPDNSLVDTHHETKRKVKWPRSSAQLR